MIVSKPKFQVVCDITGEKYPILFDSPGEAIAAVTQAGWEKIGINVLVSPGVKTKTFQEFKAPEITVAPDIELTVKE